MKPAGSIPRLAYLGVAASVVLSCVALGNGRAAASSASSAPAHAGAVHTVTVPGSDRTHRTLTGRDTSPFRMIGLTWADPAATLDGSAQVRTRDSDTRIWSGWRTLELDVHTPESGPDHGAGGIRGGTQPLWVGPSDGVQARITGTKLPDGLRVDLVDPDGGTARAGAANTAAAATVSGAPAITSRAEWGADESLVADPPTYTTDTEAVFVHHTAGTNDYTCAESASVIRGILTYHVKSNGWNDIGYNFFVDKCGTLFEGRAGGIDRPVYGAHTYGFNTDTSGVAVLGDFNAASTTPAVRDAITRLAAWKLGLYGVNPAGTIVMAAGADNGKFTPGQKVTMNRISGHRDGFPTECGSEDGDGFGSASAFGDLDHDGFEDAALTFRTADGAYPLVVARGSASGLHTDSATVLDGEGGRALATGDVNGDGYADLSVGQPASSYSGEIVTRFGSSNGLEATETAVIDTGDLDSSGVGSEAGTSLAAGDTDGDGYADLLVGAPGGAGRARLLHGSAGGLTATGAVTFVQGSGGVPGAAEAGDRFGSAVTLTDLDGDGAADAALGAEGENAGDGTVMTLTGGVSTSYGPSALATATGQGIGAVLTG